MTDLIRRDDAYAAIRGLTRHIDRIAAITAITAVQPDAAAIREAALREALLAIDALPEYESPDVNIGAGNAYSAIFALIGKPGHVNETPKSEHDAANVLTPATKGGS